MAKINKNLKTQGGGKMGISGRTKEGNGRRTSAAPLSWYAAQPAEGGPAYALTSSGYVIL